jgi:hypothetical protein
MYPKGGQMLHTIRQLVADDAKWREMLRGLNRTFRHQTVTGAEVQAWMSAQAGMDLSKVFAQYLTTTQVPALEYRLAGDTLSHRWADVVPGFNIPYLPMLAPVVDVAAADGPWTRIRPTEAWQTLILPGATAFRVNPDFYVVPRPSSEP